MKKVLVIPDIHGKSKLLLNTMLAPHKDADRIIQLGDLANCVPRDRAGDLLCLEIAEHYNFEMLVGNHEYPYWGGPRFSGFGLELPEVKEAIFGLDWKVAATVGDTLITHAGLHPLFDIYENADEAARTLNLAYKINPLMSVFSHIGYYREGKSPHGGILWRDYNEECSNKYPQVFGHSKGQTVRSRFEDRGICIDCEKPYIMWED